MTGRSVLIVGGSSGIGLATAKRLGAAGDRLTLMARSSEGLRAAEDTCRSAGATEVTTIAGDIGIGTDARRGVAAALQAYGRLDIVIHTATVMSYGSIEDTPAEIFTAVVDVAVHGTLHLAQAAMPVFREQSAGNLIVVNSLLGSVTVPEMGAYATAKWGQRALVRTLQQETGDNKNIHICMVSPGSTNTPIYYQAANYTGRSARPPAPVQQPEQTAAVIADLTLRPRKHVSIPVGPPNPLIITGFRLLPWLYDRLVGPLFKLGGLTRPDLAANGGNVESPVAAGEEVHGHWPHVFRSESSSTPVADAAKR
ncbi:MAG: SDR family NAD(P)-dependent oxidoreductase [Actinomycetota bacterium]|nr:SDR family NAD(P)-dependent oxidoreductase [Actinomycetota bacterium]MDQ2956448.1 SDR family NAD(P)-dependent oxidoreductase [Actinomycetota bacterium]